MQLKELDEPEGGVDWSLGRSRLRPPRASRMVPCAVRSRVSFEAANAADSRKCIMPLPVCHEDLILFLPRGRVFERCVCRMHAYACKMTPASGGVLEIRVASTSALYNRLRLHVFSTSIIRDSPRFQPFNDCKNYRLASCSTSFATYSSRKAYLCSAQSYYPHILLSTMKVATQCLQRWRQSSFVLAADGLRVAADCESFG